MYSYTKNCIAKYSLSKMVRLCYSQSYFRFPPPSITSQHLATKYNTKTSSCLRKLSVYDRPQLLPEVIMFLALAILASENIPEVIYSLLDILALTWAHCTLAESIFMLAAFPRYKVSPLSHEMDTSLATYWKGTDSY